MVGAWRFELQTSCAQGSCKKSILLVRLALFYVMVHGFGPSLAVVGPKLDPSFPLRLGRRQAGAGYARLAFTSATRMITRLPSARAARVIVSRVTETFRGSSSRSSCDLLV
jgi:hypothetical protein